MKRTDQKFLDAVERLFKDEQPVQLEMTKQQVWCMLTAVQLACRHPYFNGPTRQIVEEVSRKIGDALSANDPDLKMLFAMGWDKQFDEVRHEQCT